MSGTQAVLSVLPLHLRSSCTVWGDYPPPCCVHSLCYVPGRPQRSNQWVMCPDYNQLPRGHLQRAPEEIERGSSIALHGVITSWGSMVSSLFLWRVRLTDRPVNNLASPVSAVGGTSNCWSPTGGACHPKLHKSTLKHTHKNMLLHSVYWVRVTDEESTEGKKRKRHRDILRFSAAEYMPGLSIPGKQAEGLRVYELKGS